MHKLVMHKLVSVALARLSLEQMGTAHAAPVALVPPWHGAHVGNTQGDMPAADWQDDKWQHDFRHDNDKQHDNDKSKHHKSQHDKCVSHNSASHKTRFHHLTHVESDPHLPSAHAHTLASAHTSANMHGAGHMNGHGDGLAGGGQERAYAAMCEADTLQVLGVKSKVCQVLGVSAPVRPSALASNGCDGAQADAHDYHQARGKASGHALDTEYADGYADGDGQGDGQADVGTFSEPCRRPAGQVIKGRW